MSRPTHMTIDLGALQHNFKRVKALAPNCGAMAMIKANAYGHGLVRVAQALPHADALGVASLEEGITLREAGVTRPIVLMEGLFSANELSDAARHKFILVVHHHEHVEMLERMKTPQVFSVWLKINTGMNRLGIAPNEVDVMYARLRNAQAVKKPIGLMTHFAEADLVDHETTRQQIMLFNDCTAHLSGPRCLANSAAILAWPHSHGDWVRPGLMLYGASPFANKSGMDHALLPVMTLSSKIIAVTQVKQGGKVGYGGTWTAPEDMLIGVVGVGYGDGYPQFAHNGTPVLVNGVRSVLVGRVSMDMLTVDLRPVPNVKINDPVILWGKGLPVEEIAYYTQSSPYEILTRMTPRPKIEILQPEELIDHYT